jgi:hypothetical protein
MPENSIKSDAKSAVYPERFLPIPNERWRVCRDIDVENGHVCVGLWLQRVKTDRLKMLAIRGVLGQGLLPWPLAQLTDDEVLRLMTNLLESGRIHLHAPPAAPLVDVAWDQDKAADDDSYAPARTSTYSPPTSAPSTFGPDADGAAQAAALIAAAASGTPFCEQCAAAARAAASQQNSGYQEATDSQ